MRFFFISLNAGCWASSTTAKAGSASFPLIEFVPKTDSQVKRLLSPREDIFPANTLEGFTSAFQRRINILEENPVPGSERTLLLLERKPSEKWVV